MKIRPGELPPANVSTRKSQSAPLKPNLPAPEIPRAYLAIVGAARGRASQASKERECMEILGSLQFSGFTDAWTENRCLKRLPDGGVELSSRSYELLGYGRHWWDGPEPVWPERI